MARLTIGLDIGNHDAKTTHTSTPSGFSCYSNKPFSADEYLMYDGKYYIPNAERFPYRKDKTENDNAFILSLFGIAKEILFKATEKDAVKRKRAEKDVSEKSKIIGIQKEIEQYGSINLGVGLPPTHLATLKEKTLVYYVDHFGKGVSFEYNGYQFNLKLNVCDCYPQDVAAIIGYKDHDEDSVVNYKTFYAIDIGGETVDVVTFTDGRTDSKKSDSRTIGVLAMYESMVKDIETETGKRLDKGIIESVLRGEPTILSAKMKELIFALAQNWFDSIINELVQFGLDFETYPVIFLGGGSLLFKKFIECRNLSKYEFIENVNANAEGYEKLLANQLKTKAGR